FYTPHFLKMYAKLEARLCLDIKDKIKSFIKIENHQNLKVHKLKNLTNTYSFSVDFKVRIVFEYGEDKNTVNFLYVGSHDELY
ncbi:MAG: hypothetical protein WCO09_02385, partial [bacterium]